MQKPKKIFLGNVIAMTLVLFPSLSSGEIEKIKLLKQSTIMQTDGNKSSASIYIGASSDDGVTTSQQFFYTKDVRIESVIEVQAEDVGKPGSIFAVMRKGSGKNKAFYALNESGLWEKWAGSLKALPVAQELEKFQESERVTVFSGKLDLGEIAIYVGYSTLTKEAKPIIHVNTVPQKFKSEDFPIEASFSFKEEFSELIFDLEDYPEADNPLLTLQIVNFVDLNMDGKKDLIAHYWHNNFSAGSDFYEPVPNNLVVFLQNEDRKFNQSNIQIFGTEKVDLSGGASRKQAIGDFNSDGFLDIAYAMNREDGRPGVYPGTPNWGSLPVVMLSNGDGTYDISNPGPESIWYHAVASVPNDLGFDDVLYRPANVGVGEEPLAYRFIDEVWTYVSGYPEINGWEIQADKNVIWSTEVSAVELYLKNNNAWAKSGRIEFEASDLKVQVETWNGDLSNQRVRKILGTDRVSTAFSESCIIDGGNYFIAQLDSRLLPSDWQEFPQVSETQLKQDMPFLIFDYNDKEIFQRDDLIEEQISSKHSYRYSCADYNNDSLDDIFVSTNDGASLLYLQTLDKGFRLQSESIFPAAQSFRNKNAVRSLIKDIDEDGVLDLIYYNNSPSTYQEEVNFEIHWGE